MANVIEGKLIKILPEARGESSRGPWVRGGFVMECGEEYPRSVAFSLFGEEKVEAFKRIPAGTKMSVQFAPESREYNGRYYTELRCIAIESIGARTPQYAPQQPYQQPQPYAQPQYAAPQQSAQPQPAPQQQYVYPQQVAAQQPSLFQQPAQAPATVMPDGQDNDLPF